MDCSNPQRMWSSSNLNTASHTHNGPDAVGTPDDKTRLEQCQSLQPLWKLSLSPDNANNPTVAVRRRYRNPHLLPGIGSYSIHVSRDANKQANSEGWHLLGSLLTITAQKRG